MNNQIRVPEVFLISEDGEQIGVVPTREAVARAEEYGLDLVEVNPTAKPPVVKIIDFGQFKYEKEKKAHKQKLQQKKVETKGIRLSVRISDNDKKLRMDQAKKFFKKGHKVKIDLILKGRERQHPRVAADVMQDFAANLEKEEGLNIVREQDLTKQGARFIMVLVNKA